MNTATTTTARTLLLEMDGIDILASTPTQRSDLWVAQNRAKVRLWTVCTRSGRCVLVRTQGGLKAEAKKAARLAAYNLLQAGSLSTQEMFLNNMLQAGMERLAVDPALAVTVA
jgi:hypothetical protein